MTYREDREAERNELAEDLAARLHAGQSEATLRSLRRRLRELSYPPRSSTPLPGALKLRLRIAAPCTEDWATMRGDDRVRHCGRCDRNVYDLSQLEEDEVTALLSREGEKPCVRFYRRADGTVATKQCQSSMRKTALVAAAAVLATGGAMAYEAMQPPPMLMGAIAPDLDDTFDTLPPDVIAPAPETRPEVPWDDVHRNANVASEQTTPTPAPVVELPTPR